MSYGVDVCVYLPQLLDVRHLLLQQQLHLLLVFGQAFLLLVLSLDFQHEFRLELLQLDRFGPGAQICR